VQPAARRFGRVLKFHSNATARHSRVSVSDGGAGSWPSARVTPDYNDNQARAQRAWRKRNPDYWREYRRTHPQYRDRNRAQQLDRNDRRRERLIAKMGVSTPVFPMPSGIYQISRTPTPGIAKMDAWTVQITILSDTYDRTVEHCKERT